MSAPVQVILNPASSSGAGGRLAPDLEERLKARGVDYRLIRTERPGHARELAREAAADGAERVLAVGGDGTVHEVANGLLDGDGPPPPLAVVPLGTGNDFYRMVGVSRSLEGALDTLQLGVVRAFDVGVARWPGGQRRFVNLLGVGVDVEVIRRREGFRRLSGMTQYLTALLVAVLRFRPVPVRIVIEGGEIIEGPTTLAAVTVGPSAGGGFLLCPDARPDDGLLDLCFVDALNLPQILWYIPKVIRGRHGNLRVVRMRRFRSARIEAPAGTSLSFELDGEIMREAIPWVEMETEVGVLKVLVPGREGS